MKAKQIINTVLSLSCCIAILTACTEAENEIQPGKKASVGIDASITGEVVTKADPSYAPLNGNKTIYMYYKNGNNTAGNEKGIYTYAGGWNAAGSETDCIFWDDLVAIDSKYPFFAVAPKDLANKVEEAVEVNQSTLDNFTNSDLLMAYTDATVKQGQVSLNFKHMLAKLTVKVKVDAVSSFSSSSVSIQNAIKEYTVNYTSSAPTTDKPATVAVKTGATPTAALTPYTENTEDGGKTQVYSIILPAQEISTSGVKIKTSVVIGSGTTETNAYTYPSAGRSDKVILANGTHTTVTLTINGTTVELNSVTVSDWTQANASGDITIDKP